MKLSDGWFKDGKKVNLLGPDRIEDGKYIRYDYSGFLVEEIYFKNGLRDGIHRLYDYVGLIYEENYKDGKLHGQVLEYNMDNNMVTNVTYVMGKIHGKSFRKTIAGGIKEEYHIHGEAVSEEEFEKYLLINKICDVAI